MVYPLNEYAQEAPNRTMIADGNCELSTTETNDRINRIIKYLRASNITAGSRLAIISENNVDYLCITLAASLSGVSVVPINWHLKAEEAAYLMQTSKTDVVVIGEKHQEMAEQAAAAAGVELLIYLSNLDASLETYSGSEPESTGPFSSCIYYTSGTTGRPKGTRLAQTPSNVPIKDAVLGLRNSDGAFGQGPNTVYLTPGPLYHAAPLNTSVSAVLLGGELHLMNHFDPENMLRLIHDKRVQRTTMVPIMFVRILRLEDEVKSKYDLSSLEEVVHLAAHMPIHVKHEMIRWWGPILVDAYGSSEIGVVTRISSKEWLERPGSVGKPIPSLTLQIVDENNEEVAVGETGSIFITSLTDLDISYLNDDEKTRSVHRGEKQFTIGDVGYVDEEGYLYLVDRRVDMINSGGVNIYPAEVESTALLHPAVEDVCVFGIPNEEWGQEVKAAIQLREGFKASDELELDVQNFLTARLANYKIPKSIDFVTSMPRYSNGKLHRRELRDPYWTQE